MRGRDLATVLAVAVPIAAASTFLAGRELNPGLVVADVSVGCLFVSGGLLVWRRRPGGHTGVLMIATGVAWFVGGLVPAAVYAHRATLAHLLISYPSGRIDSRGSRAAAGIAYGYAALAPATGAADLLTLAFATVLLIAVGFTAFRRRGALRPARLLALAATATFVAVLAAGAIVRLDGGVADPRLPLAYRLALAAVAVGLLVEPLWGGWSRGVVTRLVVDLGAGGRGVSVRDQLAHALGDPRLAIGYPSPATSGFVDEAGRPVQIPSAESPRRATPLPLHDGTAGVVVHDDAILDDPVLIDTVAAAAGLAASNARLAADIGRNAAATAASRQRLVHATDSERRRLHRMLESRVDRRLERVRQLVASIDTPSTETAARTGVVREELAAVLAELRDYARGVHPVALSTGGLARAIADLADRVGIPVTVCAGASRFSAVVESTAYFVCAEALANVGKHSNATKAEVNLHSRDDSLVVSVTDDGVGGVTIGRGSGLRGLVDRVEALGGRLEVDSSPGGGTTLTARIPAGGGPA